MAHEAYAFGDDLLLPLQFVIDLLPGMLPAAYRFDPRSQTLYVEGAVSEARPANPRGVGSSGSGGGGAPGSALPPSVLPASPEPADPPPSPPGERAPRSRVVVIDPGHGGAEPGAVGPGGTREKTIALAVALALARELARDPWIEVHLTRDRDVAVPIWGRGEQATMWKGDRPGVFVSIHANAVPDRPGVRGFETYFLSEARTEHERRVAAAENAPLLQENPDAPMAGLDDPLLAGILRDLITFDHQHWSALLAEKVQRELATFHPGPDRGVKQGPFAVITNALMPSVLVELGFISNREEEQLMVRPEFHRQSAVALANAIRAFFDRYPPGGTH
jgi:N-acetylmuramoyl-L-alanine amidase